MCIEYVSVKCSVGDVKLKVYIFKYIREMSIKSKILHINNGNKHFNFDTLEGIRAEVWKMLCIAAMSLLLTSLIFMVKYVTVCSPLREEYL